MPDRRLNDAVDLLDRFAERTGLGSPRTPQRYLWTDAFAVCTWLGLARTTWARELAVRAFEAFSYVRDGGAPRLYWKMSIDLTRAAVASQGQHDPLDGYVTCVQLHTTAKTAPADFRRPAIDGLADELVASIELSELNTTDPLGLGGLLFDAARIEQLAGTGAFRTEALAASVLATAATGIAAYERSGGARREIRSRLPFRELGLVLGLRAVELVAGTRRASELRRGCSRPTRPSRRRSSASGKIRVTARPRIGRRIAARSDQGLRPNASRSSGLARSSKRLRAGESLRPARLI